MPFETAVRLQFDRFRGFVEEFSANLSLGGMFIRTEEPREIGTEMPIEFRLGEDYELIRGKGRVVWVREEGLDEEYPAGMGIRFLELTPGSRELIFKLVERRVREGGEPFDLDAEAEILEDLPQRPPDPGPAPEKAPEAPGATAAEDGGGSVAAQGGAVTAGAATATAPEDEELDPWEEPTPNLSPPAPPTPAPPTRDPSTPDPGTSDPPDEPDRFTSAAAPEPGSDSEEREPFYLGAPPRDASPGEEGDETDFSEETFSAGASRTAATGASLGAGPSGESDVDEDGDGDAGAEADAPSLPGAPAATPSLDYTPEGGGAAYDDEQERSVLRRRGLVLGLVVLLVAGGLALGWWLLGEPPELAASGPGATTAAPDEPAVPVGDTGSAADAAPADPVDASDVEGGLEAVGATPPGREPVPRAARGSVEESVEEPRPAGADRGAAGAATAAQGGPRRIESVSHVTDGDSTTVVIQASWRLEEGDYVDFRIGGPSPRHVVRLVGVEEPLPAGQVAVGSDQVERVRSGLHLDRDPAELHLVLDLASEAARVAGITHAGDTLRVVVEKGAE